jgi:tellurite resistance protein TerC
MTWLLGAFVTGVVVLLVLDLGFIHPEARAIPLRQAMIRAAVWVGLGLAFSLVVFVAYGHRWAGLGASPDPVDGLVNTGASAAVKYLTGYVVEESLSVDNLFVMAVIFSYFRVPPALQHRVLFWGILGAIVMRGGMIGVGVALITRFRWVLYVFGVLLIVTAIRMLRMKPGGTDPGRNAMVRLARRFFPVTTNFHDKRFVIRAGPRYAASGDQMVAQARRGAVMLTPLAIALITIETTDLLFALDSIPAIFAITADPFLVFTSNVCAVMGLRSLYSALAHLLDRFRYLNVALAIVLMLVGLKMLAAQWLVARVGHGFTFYFLGVVMLVLGAGIVLSMVVERDERRRAPTSAGSPQSTRRTQRH